MSFDNGPPPVYRHPSYPPPTPVQQHPAPYEQPMYHQPSGGPPDGLYPITYATTGKRKAQRASQVCVPFGVDVGISLLTLDLNVGL